MLKTSQLCNKQQLQQCLQLRSARLRWASLRAPTALTPCSRARALLHRSVGLSLAAVALSRWRWLRGPAKRAGTGTGGGKAQAASGSNAVEAVAGGAGASNGAALPVHEAEQDQPVHLVGSSVNLPDMSGGRGWRGGSERGGKLCWGKAGAECGGSASLIYYY